MITMSNILVVDDEAIITLQLEEQLHDGYRHAQEAGERH
jgi:CheY-like chemotaxis protein